MSLRRLVIGVRDFKISLDYLYTAFCCLQFVPDRDRYPGRSRPRSRFLPGGPR